MKTFVNLTIFISLLGKGKIYKNHRIFINLEKYEYMNKCINLKLSYAILISKEKF